MMTYILFVQIINPFVSANLLAPDDYTDDYFVTIYQFELENDFYRKNVGAGIYIDYLCREEYPYSDPYFIKSGIPVGLSAVGAGLQFKYLDIGDIEFGVKFGYYIGNISYPALKDSGIVIREEKGRNSLGLGTGVNLMHNFGIIKGGIRFWVNFIGFDAKSPRPYWYYQRSPDYISLSSVGLGIVFGLNRRQEK
ncbi:MAG: hypothetical protein ACPL28_07340 [bacterium]